ncbi:hypothetical protein F4677DRAFT_80853 [Hypoxylon crocopeplum]|nr:hypothetical protein F4677DRAFT_80853 [Hypoxylon crocopeplum]
MQLVWERLFWRLTLQNLTLSSTSSFTQPRILDQIPSNTLPSLLVRLLLHFLPDASHTSASFRRHNYNFLTLDADGPDALGRSGPSRLQGRVYASLGAQHHPFFLLSKEVVLLILNWSPTFLRSALTAPPKLLNPTYIVIRTLVNILELKRRIPL